MLLNDPSGFPEGALRPEVASPAASALHVCEVHDVLAYGHCYLVKPFGMPRMPALLGTQSSSLLPVGARDASMIVPGSLVLCWIPQDFYPVILCALSVPQGSGAVGIPDSIVSASHAGLFADSAHKTVAGKEMAHGFFDFSSGRPIDNVPGDWGMFNELGMGLFLGKLLTFIRASDACKIEAHYTDNLLRVFGYNMQQYTAGSEAEAFDDEGQWTNISSFTPFTHEAYGSLARGNALTINQDADPNLDSATFGIEPVDVRQTGLYRFREFAGALGDLRRRFVMAPNTIFKSEVMRYGRSKTDAAAYTGLFDELIGLDGSWRLRSAKSVMIEKSIFIPVPEELAPRDNPEGDTDLEPTAPPAEYPAQGTPGEVMARLLDKETYAKQKQLSDAVNQHEKDWHVRDTLTGDEKMALPGALNNEEPPLAPYNGFSQPLPESADQEIAEGRTQKYYKGTARIGLTEDGGFIIEDAYGACIRSVGGNIEITCPGDVIMRPGKNMQTWAGKDVIIKSQESTDISSATRDVRIKAEKNVMVLGGNAGDEGGVLIENRSSSTPNYNGTGNAVDVGGLVLKSSRGTLAVMGESVYLKAFSSGMVIDSNSGTSDITIYGNNIVTNAQAAVVDILAAQGAETPAANTSVTGHYSGGHMVMYGSSMSIGSGNIQIVNHKGTGNAASTSVTLKGSLTLDGSGAATGGFNETDGDTGLKASLQRIRQDVVKYMRTINQQMLQQYTNDIGRQQSIGGDQVYPYIGFSFRATAELGITGLKIYEAPWQRRFRLTAGVTADQKYSAVWEEPVVAGRVDQTGKDDLSKSTLPFPGKDAWVDGTGGTYSQVDQQFYMTDADGGHPLPRGAKGSNYDTIELPPEQAGAFKDRYPVNR